MDYTVKRSGRKTLAIRVNAAGDVEVLAPRGLSAALIDKIVGEKSGWIEKKRAELTSNARERRPLTPEFGGTAPYRGAERKIIPADGVFAGFDGENFYFPRALEPQELKAALVGLYKRMAKRYITERTAYFSAVMGVTPSAVKISSAKTRWGSCSGKNSVSFTWRLVLAGDVAIDAVVVHELAHIKEHNHGENFWKTVESILPDYKKREEQLKQLQKTIIFD